jgi:hypothetical protein
MKKQLLFIIAFISCSFSPAIAQKGTWLWYGNLGGHNATSDAPIVNGDKWSINTQQGIGYQFSNHWHAGLQGSYGYSSGQVFNTLGGLDDLKNSTWTAGLFFRYTVGKRLYAFVQGDLSWAGSKQKVNDVEVGDSHGVGVGLTPTVGVNVYRGWCLNLSFANISWNSTNPSNNINSTDFVYNIGQTFVFGISKIFGHGVNCPAPANAPAPAPNGK